MTRLEGLIRPWNDRMQAVDQENWRAGVDGEDAVVRALQPSGMTKVHWRVNTVNVTQLVSQR